MSLTVAIFALILVALLAILFQPKKTAAPAEIESQQE